MKYISILRGINVSGQKIIKMADLKALYEAIGFERVTTYIQSGNVIFDSNGANKADLEKAIEIAIKEKYSFHVPVAIRTHKEFNVIVDNCPYKEADAEENGTKVLVTFLHSTPEKHKQKLLLEYVKHPERLVIHDSEVYLYCQNGYGKSKLTNTFIESKLGMSATTRNWKSVKTLNELSNH